MKYLGMPAGMWALFAGSFRKKLTDVLKYDRNVSMQITKKAQRHFQKLIHNLPLCHVGCLRSGNAKAPEPG